MSYKSYAQGGQFSTYSIDLPIKTEINEDLRAAGDFAAQMERSQQYREKWANSYLTALNNKSSIERQNRDDNFEFLQNNFKAIYEGEQREFEGRMGELRREQAKAANAEPDFLEKVLPALIKLAPQIISMVGTAQEASFAAEQEHMAGINQQIQQDGHLMAHGETKGLQRLFSSGKLDGQPGLEEQIIQSYIDKGVFKSKQDMMTYINASGKLEAFRDVAAYQNAMPSIQAAIQHDSRPHSGGSLDPALHPMQDGNYSQIATKYLSDAQRHYLGDRTLNDTTQIEVVSKFRASEHSRLMRQADGVWDKQAVRMKDEHDTNIINFISTQEDYAPQFNNLYTTEKQRLIANGINPQEAHMSALGTTLGRLNNENSMVSPDQILEFQAVHNADKKQAFISRGETPPANFNKDGRPTWTHKRFKQAYDKALQRSFKATTHATNTRLNDEKKKKNAILAKANSLEGAQQRDFITQVQKEHESSGMISSQGFDAWIKSLGHNSVIPKSKTFEQQTGMTKQSLVDTTTRLVVGKMTGAGSAHNNKQTKGDLTGLQSTQETIEEVVANAQVNWTKYAGEFPHITNPEALRKEILTRSYQDLMDKGEISLENVNADGTAKDPAKPVVFKGLGGDNPTGMTIPEFEDKMKTEGLNGKKFTSLYLDDDAVYKRFVIIRGSMPEGEDPDYRDMQSMANTKRMRLLKKIFKDKYTVYELMDLELKSLGYEGLRNIPITKAQAEKNRGIAKQLLMGGKTLTTPAIKFANDGFQPSAYAPGPLIAPEYRAELGTHGYDSGVKDYKGRPAVFQNQAASDSYSRLAQQFPWLGSATTSTQRSLIKNNSLPLSSTTSNHLEKTGKGGYDMVGGAEVEALANSNEGEAANWSCWWHVDHWHCDFKGGN